MDIADKNTERSTLIIAVMALVTIGLSLIVSTGQTLNRQEEAGTQHLILTARSVLQAVETSLRRGLFMRPNGPGLFSPGTAELFRELEQSGDVLFVGIIDRQGGRVLTSRPTQEAGGTLVFPPEALQDLAQKGEWHGRATFGKLSAYVYGKRILPRSHTLMHDTDLDDTGQARPEAGADGGQAHAPGQSGPSGSFGQGDFSSDDPNQLPTFLVVGLDMAKHLAVYRGFRQNALFQAAYILAAAVFIWVLTMSFLKRREQAGRAAVLERFQARLVDNLPDGLLTITQDNVVRAANPAAHDIMKARDGSLAGMDVADLPPEVAGCIAGPDSGATPGWANRTVDGAHLEILTLPIRESDEEHDRLVIIRDRTQIRELEKSLSEAEKLAAVGTLAAGVAHEIRNPLSALRGFAQYFAKKLAGKQPDENYAQTMVREADRLNRVITDLLYLARPRAIEPREVSLGQLAAELESLVRFDAGKLGVHMRTSLGPDLVMADEDALKQALLNLVLNSLDALSQCPQPAGGVGREIHISSMASDGGVWVFVRDTGPGMSREQREQAFEPFYTTKKKGTGLGLALVHKTMRDHGGRAQIDSEVGRGTTVALFFPGAGHAARTGQAERAGGMNMPEGCDPLDHGADIPMGNCPGAAAFDMATASREGRGEGHGGIAPGGDARNATGHERAAAGHAAAGHSTTDPSATDTVIDITEDKR
ncbi:two-component system sensor histidine kinase NtrB [Nitratidesulfovibrio sp. SRB-5]|uniref:two-component system sensor histidine kinase NtrB n=1 Tax=Nitratidesulfovibrio sp. SRB-5 TaxID=2872636 RepID=UPI00102823EB|nr:ATP-binding protein [Nitratidesulfovibrio sp. SRB-5]MBZ2171601.1 PAS domain-containing protein [Nitratidesulfovibrio sp. SRB-5]RXF78089.1 PAS domain-containing sensor histidine kinase [Desulfovibrio sp. DS-1]